MNISLDGVWLIGADPENVGVGEEWWRQARPDAKSTRVPWVIQDAFPGYHGVAWYWREFSVDPNPHPEGRTLLQFGSVDHKADVWVNDIHVGTHENAEIPFTFDITRAVKPGKTNRIAVRVLNASLERIDGVVLGEIPHRNKVIPPRAGASVNHGGITDSLTLMQVPSVRVEDVFCRPDWQTGQIRVTATLVNASPAPVKSVLSFSAAPASSGLLICREELQTELSVGESVVDVLLQINQHRLWSLIDPFLYRVSVQCGASELSVRCGFRDFRFRDGHFMLNGERIFLKGSHTGNHFPAGLQVPSDPDFARRDLIYAKMSGFNLIRFIAGMPTTWQLDLCDELGLMVYDENYAGWCLQDSPRMAEFYDRSYTGMIKRDRNHPSVVIWGMLNEEGNGPVFRHAAESIPLVRALDDTRMLILCSGRFDTQLNIGSICNPGSNEWECLLGDQDPDRDPAPWPDDFANTVCGYIEGGGDIHMYPFVPQSYEIINLLRTVGENEKNNVFLSEYGIGSAVNWSKIFRQFEQIGKSHVDDAQFYKLIRDYFLRDWERFNMADTWASPDDYLDQCIAKMASQRSESLTAVRSNPRMAGYSITGTLDQGMTGEGLWTQFRDLKPGTMDALYEGWAPLRWCLFAQPENILSGAKTKLEAVLVNEDVLMPGEYPVRIQLVAPNGTRVLDKNTTLTIPQDRLPFAIPVYSEELTIVGPTGKYKFEVQFTRGASGTCSQAFFYVTDPADMPGVDVEVVLWGDDHELADWLICNNIKHRPYDSQTDTHQLILVGNRAGATDAEGWQELVSKLERGSAAVFLCPEVFAGDDDHTKWIPLEHKGAFRGGSDLYIRDDWAKDHPIFAGLPTGIMEYTYYRTLIPHDTYDTEVPAEVAAAGIRAAIHPTGYTSGVLVGTYKIGAGMLTFNCLKIRENLNNHPAAQRLLRNMLIHAGASIDK